MSAYSDLVLSHGANAYWRLNEPSGTTAADSAGTRTGTLAGTGTVLGVAGRLAGELAMSFDGNGRILPSSMPSLGSAFTLEAWVKPTTAPGAVQWGLLTRQIFSDGDFQWTYRATTTVRLNYFSGSGSNYDTLVALPLGGWTHLAVTGSAGQVVLYVNGVAQPGQAVTLSGAGAGPVAIAGFAEAGTETWGWQGSLQDVAMYPTALSAAQILNHHTVGSTVEVSVPSAGCDHTTVWSKHLATLSAPTVESERAYLATLYGEPGGTDVSTLVSRYLQAITCGTAVAPPAAPTLSLVSPNTGTQGTMVTVTLTGTGFIANATGVTVNGVGISVVNIHVLSPTSLTADLAIDAAAPPTARSITVSTAGGSASQAFTVSAAGLTTLPTTNLTLHVDASDADHLWKTFVSGGPNTGVPIDGDTIAVWEREPDDALTHLLKQSGATGLPVWRSTTPLMRRPCVDFAGGQQLQLTDLGGSPQILASLITASAYTLLVAFWAESVPVNPVYSQPYGGGPLIGDSGSGYWGAFLHLNGAVPTVTAYNYDGTNTYVSIPCPIGTAHVFMARHQSGVVYASLDGGAETSLASGATAVLAGSPQIGGGAHGQGTLEGRIGELVLYNTALTGTALSDALSYFTSKWL